MTTTPTVMPATKSKSLTFPEMLERYKAQIARALPKHLTADRMIRIALTEYRKNKDLAECDPQTIFASIIIASQLGLEPGLMGQAYLIPYKKKCTLVPGWQGYIDLVKRSGRAQVWTGVVHEGDSFEYQMGTSPMIEHRCGDSVNSNSNFTHAYAVGREKDSQWPVIEVWSRRKIENHLREYNKVGDKHYALQGEHNFEMYGRKVPLLQVIKYMPKSIEVQNAVNLDHGADAGNQIIDVREALDGTFLPSGYPEDDRPASPLSGVAEIPEMPQIIEHAKKLGWNDADISNELGRVGNDGKKLLRNLLDLLQFKQQAQSIQHPTPASEAAVRPAETQPSKETSTKQQPRTAAAQRQLSDVKDF